MKTEHLSSLEAAVLSKLNEGYNSLEKLKENININELTLQNVLNSLITKNILVFDKIKKQYSYDTPVIGDKIILNGNILLGVTIIRDKNRILVNRGKWYEFPLDFDTRRIIWNVQLPSQNKSTLIDLVKESILKEKKTNIIQLPEYKNIVGRLVPYNNNIKLKLNTIGETLSDISILFVLPIQMKKENIIGDSDISTIDFRGFNVRSVIKTEELINQLTCPVEERDFEKITLNRIFNFNDFLFINNEIPISITQNKIEYIKLTNIKNKIQLTYYEFDNTGNSKKINTEDFLDINEGIKVIKEYFEDIPKQILSRDNFLVELN